MINVNVREYKSGDSAKIYELFSEFTPYVRDDKFWVWINRMLSEEKSLIIVGEVNGSIVGHYAVIPQNMKIGNQIYNVGFAIHAFIHPDYRNTFMIFQITKKMYKVSKERGIEFIYGFPNINFRDIQVKADKWKKVSLFKALEKNILTKKEIHCNLVELNKDYSDFYFLSEIMDNQIINTNTIKLKKSLNYYINRYIQHPQSLYQNFFINKEGKKVAFIVLKVYENENEKTGHLIDFIATNDISFSEIISVVENYFYDNVDKLSFWKFGKNQKQILFQNDFKENGFETFLGVKMLNNNQKLEDQLIDFENWEICMGDSDAF